MEPWQRIGVYAAGLALDDAGIKGDAAAKDRLDVIVAAGGGERDHAVDGQVLTGLKTAADPGVFLNERLMGDLRPTLFLAQLSNLLAGNISIVHGVTGPSRTFMGEEQAGVDAIRVAQARIAAGQSDMILVGGSYNAERRDMLLLFELGGFVLKGAPAPVFERTPGADGMVTGSLGAFLVLEAADAARARGAAPKATLSAVAASRARRGKAACVKRSPTTSPGPATGSPPSWSPEPAASRTWRRRRRRRWPAPRPGRAWSRPPISSAIPSRRPFPSRWRSRRRWSRRARRRPRWRPASATSAAKASRASARREEAGDGGPDT